jgi:hypothetical protein
MPLNPVPNYPASLDSLPDPTSASFMDDDGFEVDLLLAKHNAILEALESRVGVDAADASQLGSLRFNDGLGNSKLEELARANLLLNSQFTIWQRGTSFTVDGVYTADRWRASLGSGGSPAYTVSRQSHTLGDLPGEPEFFLRFNQTAQATSTPPTLEQRIEGVRRVANQKVTISVWARCSSGTVVVTPRVVQSFGTGGSPSAAVNTDGATITVTTAWTRYSRTITVPTIAGKTLGSGGNDYLAAMLRFPTSATFQVDISQVKVEIGSTASAFQPIPLALDLAGCERYFQKSYVLGTAPGGGSILDEIIGQASNSVAASTAGLLITPAAPYFRTRMRGTPAVTLYNPSTGAANSIRVAGTTDRSGSTAGAPSSVRPYQTISIDNTSATAIADRAQTQLHYAADAEL